MELSRRVGLVEMASSAKSAGFWSFHSGATSSATVTDDGAAGCEGLGRPARLSPRPHAPSVSVAQRVSVPNRQPDVVSAGSGLPTSGASLGPMGLWNRLFLA